MTKVNSTALFDVDCPGCGGSLAERYAPFRSPYVVPVTHRQGRKRCRLLLGVSSTGTRAHEVPSTESYGEALLKARRDLGVAPST